VSWVDNEGAKLYWDEVGTGEPLLLISGLGTTAHVWQRTREVLAESHRTIALDNRGVGRSEVPPGAYSIALMASDALAVLDAAGVADAHVFGASMGGMIAQELCLQHPSRVRSLIVGCTTAGAPMGPHAVQPAPETLSMLTRQGMTIEESIAAFNPLLYHPDTPSDRIEAGNAIRRRWFPTGRGYFGQLLGVSAWDAYDRLPGITVPTLVIHGEADKLIPAANAEIIAERIRGAKLVLLSGASHVFWTDQPDATHHAILEFLSEVSR
jgi:pimeloyl-ACP methyl ester carboxylesterase